MIIYEEILKEFQKRKVRYIIVGGIALNLLGSMRNTADLDILAEMTDQNLTKIVNILKKFGYRVKIPVDPIGIADARTRQEWIHGKNMKALNFYHKDGYEQVDIIISSPVSYQQAVKFALQISIAGLPRLPVCSREPCPAFSIVKCKMEDGAGFNARLTGKRESPDFIQTKK